MAGRDATSAASSISDEIHIYAELLPNLRQLSLAVTLPSPADGSTQAGLLLSDADSESRARLRVTHGDAAREIALPGRPSQLARLSPPQKGSLSLAWRVPLAQQGRGAGTSARGGNSNDAAAPWSAPELVPGGAVRCRRCRAAGAVVAPGKVGAWKDLPSENWAEMMEFWHCHKPDHHHGHGHGQGQSRAVSAATNGEGERETEERLAVKKGYGAASAIRAQAGTGFVDLMGLLFAEEDCGGITYSQTTFEEGSTERSQLSRQPDGLRNLSVFCSSCRTQLGHFSFRTMGITLFKWRVDVETSSTVSTATPAASPTIAHCLSANLVAMLARSGSSKSLIVPLTSDGSAAAGPEAKALHVWILNANIVYASSSRSGSVPAIKLLYQLVSVEQADKMLESLSSDVQEVSLPEDAVREVIAGLDASNCLLPAKERVFREWQVGLLERWVGL